MNAVEVDVSKRCAHGCFHITLGSDSQWHLPGAGTFSSEVGEAWVFHREELDQSVEQACDCFDEEFE